mgnify:CR=1 FL=1
MSTEKLDEFHYHELLDRLSVTTDNIYRNIIQHPVINKHYEWREEVDAALEILYDLYQEVGKYKLDN